MPACTSNGFLSSDFAVPGVVADIREPRIAGAAARNLANILYLMLVMFYCTGSVRSKFRV